MHPRVSRGATGKFRLPVLGRVSLIQSRG